MFSKVGMDVASRRGRSAQVETEMGVSHQLAGLTNAEPICPLRVIHVIPAIPACSVRSESGHSAKARFYEYERAHHSF